MFRKILEIIHVCAVIGIYMVTQSSKAFYLGIAENTGKTLYISTDFFQKGHLLLQMNLLVVIEKRLINELERALITFDLQIFFQYCLFKIILLPFLEKIRIGLDFCFLQFLWVSLSRLFLSARQIVRLTPKQWWAIPWFSN